MYFDFTCPYVHSAAAWLREVNRQLGDSRIEVWKFFPLDQVNAPADADMPIWDLPPTAAAVVATAFTRRRRRRQGREAFERFHAALLTLKHEEGQDHGKRSTLDEAASRLDSISCASRPTSKTEAPCRDRERLRRRQRRAWRIRHAHVCLPNGQSAYLRILPPPPPEEAVAFWLDFVRTFATGRICMRSNDPGDRSSDSHAEC